MGLKSRRKGAAFERLIARQFREWFPQYAHHVRRGKQSHLADECDVPGLPGIWSELEDAVDPSPLAKLDQAIGDAPPGDIPVAITHKTRARRIKATLRLSDLVRVWLLASESPSVHAPVTVDLDDWLYLLKHALPRMQERKDNE